ncbi:MAG: 30S ribosomal protein S4 [Nanoarchaeota archaeon]
MAWTRKHKRYSRPRKPFDKQRIEEENKIAEEFGLKNKREIWKAEAAVGRLRRRAKKLITASAEKQGELFNKLKEMGLKVTSIPEVLALQKSDWMQRRLQTIVMKKKLAKTPKQARQMIAHKLVMIDGNIVNQPSYIVTVEEENKISLREAKAKKETKTPKEEVKQNE